MIRARAASRLAVAATFAALHGCDNPDPRAFSTAQPGVEDAALDWSADPCGDFYQFACGNWMRWHDIPGDSATVMRLLESQASTPQLLLQILADDAAGHPQDPGTDPWWRMLGDFYGACMDENANGPGGRDVIAEQIGKINGITSPEDLAAVLASLHADGIDALFNLAVDRDLGNARRLLLWAWPGGLGLPDLAYYTDPAQTTILDRYREHVELLQTLTPVTPPRIDPTDVLAVESALAVGVPADPARSDPRNQYRIVPAADLYALTPHFRWDVYLAAAGAEPPSELNVAEPEFFAALDALLATSSLARIRSYLHWRVLEQDAVSLGARPRAEEYRFHNGVMRGIPREPPRYWSCYQFTFSYLSYALAEPYVAARFTADDRAAAGALIDRVQAAFRQHLTTLAWLDEPTRAAALGKLDGLIKQIGYPDAWPSYDAFTIGRTSFLDNQVGMLRLWRKWNLGAQGATAGRGGWGMSPATVNAYYDPTSNDITFPAAILQPPLFDVGQPAAINHGAIGTVMGHEMTHGFDSSGRLFDVDGSLHSWWSDPVAAEFDRRAACLVAQYDSYEALPGVHVDGRLTLGENIADAGGLKLSWLAFKSAAGGDDVMAPSGGLFSPAQQFFLAHAQVWCANELPASVKMGLRTDPHSPPRFRVNGAVRNLPEFAEAFRCPTGAPLAPPAERRCELW